MVFAVRFIITMNLETRNSILSSGIRVCPLCGRDNTAAAPHHYSRHIWLLKRCSECGMLYLENPPAYASLEDELAWEKTYTAESHARRKRNWLLYHAGRAPKALWQRLFKRDKLIYWVRRYFTVGPILDVGCAGGHTFERLPTDFIPYGIEISAELSRSAQQRFASRGGHVVQSDAISGLRRFDAGFFNGVVMTSFLEHEMDPRGALDAAGRVLHPRGRLIVKVPNYASWNRVVRGRLWCGFRFPDHVNYFTPRLLGSLLELTGFKLLRFGISEHLPTSDNMWALAERARK